MLDGFFDTALIDKIYQKADQLFRQCRIYPNSIYSEEYATLEGLTYEQLASSQKVISLKEVMLQIPEYVDIAFHETILRITANFLKYIPPVYQGLGVRDFPFNKPRESSNFHKDNDEADSLQIFIYLNDIDDTQGMQVYVPGSHRHDSKSCRPRLSRDLGLEGFDGRYSDEEIKKHYPTWAFLRPKRGSVGFISGNGIHKGPHWAVYGDHRNQARTALRIDVHGYKVSRGNSVNTERELRRQDYERLSSLQKLFTRVYAVVD